MSSRLSCVYLQVEDYPLGFEWDGEIDYPAWAEAEVHLCRLAKRFSVNNPGTKMGVHIYGGDKPGAPEDCFLERVKCKTFLPKLKGEALFYVSNTQEEYEY